MVNDIQYFIYCILHMHTHVQKKQLCPIQNCVCVKKRVCDMVTMSSVTRLRQCVTLRDRECDTAKCPPLSSLPTPAFLSSLSHNMQLCKALRKVFCNRVEIFKCCDFQGSKFVGFPSESRLHPRFVRKCGLRGSGDESESGYSVVRAYPLHFTPLQNVSISRVLLQAPRPSPDIQTLRYLLLSYIGDIELSNRKCC